MGGMKIISALLLLLATSPIATATEPLKATVHVFLKEDCPIARYHTKTLVALHERFASQDIKFHGYLPSSKATEARAAAFKKQFALPFPVEADVTLTKARQLGATVTPEVVVVDSGGKTLYQGRIDNTYADFGKRRRVTTSHDVRDVLEALTNGETVEPKQTEAIGCLIPIAKS